MKGTKDQGEARNRRGGSATDSTKRGEGGDEAGRSGQHRKRDASDKREGSDELREERPAEDIEPTVAPVSGVAMSGTGAPVRSRSHSGTTTMPGAGPSPNPIVTPETKKS